MTEWVIDPKNPNRATFTDPSGKVHEAFRQAPAPEKVEYERDPNGYVPPKGARMGPAPGQEAAVIQPQASFGQRFGEAYDRATSMAGTGEIGALSRGLEDLFNIDDSFQQAQLGGTPEEREYLRDQDRVRKVREARSLWAAMDEADPAWREDGNLFGNVSRFTAGLLGDIAGNANPSYMIGGGKTVAERMAVQGAANAGIDASLQGIEMGQGIQDEFDPRRMAMQFLAGAAIQGGLEGGIRTGRYAAGDKNAFKTQAITGPDFDPDLHPRETIEVEGIQPNELTEADFRQEMQDALLGGAPQEFIEDIYRRYGKAPDGRPVSSDYGADAEFQAPDEAFTNALVTGKGLEADRPDLAAANDPERRAVPRPAVSKAETQAAVAEKTKSWKNAPEFEIVESVDQIADPAIRQAVNDPDILGFYGPDGKVRLVSNNLQNADEIAPALFHEALGHHGLAQKFGNGLDAFLDRMYQNSPDMRRMVDEWDADYGKGYGDVPITTKVEEVLAKMSEQKELKQSFIDKIKDFLKQYARQAGINLEFSEREIRSILASAHSAVTRGPRTAETPSGVRFIYAGRKGSWTPEEKESGWFTGPDGRQRREISDEDAAILIDSAELNDLAKFQEEGNSVRLADFFSHPDLYRVYPELKYTEVRFDTKGAGSYDETNNILRLNPRMSPEETLKTILHETQHSVQGIEDFARGGNPDSALDKAAGAQLRSIGEAADVSLQKGHAYYADIRDQLDNIFYTAKYRNAVEEMRQMPKENGPDRIALIDARIDLQEQMTEELGLSSGQSMDVANAINTILGTRGDSFADVMDQIIRKTNNVLGSLQQGLDAIRNPQMADAEYRDALKAANKMMTRNALTPNPPGFEAYQRLFGEVEARDVEARMGMSAADREFTEPYSSEPFNRQDYIFDFSEGDSIGRQSIRRDSEASRSGDRIRLTTSNVKKGATPGQAAKTFLNELGVFNNRELSEMSNKEAIDRAARLGVDQEWLDYYNDAKWNPETKTTDTPSPRPDMNKYLPDTKFMKRRDDERRVGNIDLDRVFTRNDITDAITEAAKGYDKKTVSHDETVSNARALGLTPAKVAKRHKISTEEASDYIVGAMDVLARQGEEIARLTDKVIAGEASPNDVARLAHATGVYSEIVPSVMKTRSEIGRALNAMKISYRRGKEAEEILRLIEDSGGSTIFSNPDLLLKFAKQLKAVEGDDAAMAKLTKDAFSPKAEDVLFSLWYNIDLLSRPSTQYNNFMGTLENIVGELTAKALAVPTGQARKLVGNSDRVAIRELLARVAGTGVGALEGLINAPKAFALARPVTGVSKEAYRPAPIFDIMSEMTKDAPPIVRYPTLAGAGAVETTSRAMAVVDEFFRAIAHNSEVYGQAARRALADNEPGTFAEKLYSYKREPTEKKISELRLAMGKDTYADPKNRTRHDIQDEATSQADIATFRDRSSPLIGDLERRLRPNIDDNPATRALKFGVRVIVPFIRMGDAMVRSTVRTTPLIGMLDRYNKADWKAGGARRDVVIGRMTLGLGLGYLAAIQTMNGERSGNGPSNAEKRMEMEDGGWKPNSIRQEDGSWVSKRNLGPFNTYMNTVAAITEGQMAGELDDKGAGSKMVDAFKKFMTGIVQNAGIEQMTRLMAGEDDKGDLGLSSIVSSFAIPGALQSYTQNFVDTAVRSGVPADAPASSKDKTFEQRVEGRVKSAYPGYSEELPQKYDVYGRKKTRPGGFYGALTANREGTPETNAAVKELARLSKTLGDKALIDQPEKTLSMGSKKAGTFVQKKLTEGEFEKYKGLSGYYITYITAEQMATPEWKAMSDEEKVETVKEIKSFARKVARTQLFIEQEEEETPVEPIVLEETYIEE